MSVPERRDYALAQRLRDPPRRLLLADLPTPVTRAKWLDGPRTEVWIKRDDLSSELYGGGKVRKLEYSLGNPPYDGNDTVTSVGGIGSNHLVALALYLQRLDRKLHAIVFDQPMTPHVHTNLATMASVGSTFWYAPHRWRFAIAWLRFHAVRDPKLGKYMTPGGSTPMGCLGFVSAGLELAAQIDAGEVPRPDTVYVTGGTGGAAAGLAMGLALAGVGTRLKIVSAVETLLFNQGFMWSHLRAIHHTLGKHGLEQKTGLRRLLRSTGVSWSIDHGQVGPCYGAPTPAGRSARRLAEENGVHLDTTYTGKCVAALRRGEDQGVVLFWHTHASQDLSHHIVPGWEQRLPSKLRRRLAATPAGFVTSSSSLVDRG